MTEALPLITELTWGTMANKVVMTMGVGSGEVLGEALASTAKRSRVVARTSTRRWRCLRR